MGWTMMIGHVLVRHRPFLANGGAARTAGLGLMHDPALACWHLPLLSCWRLTSEHVRWHAWALQLSRVWDQAVRRLVCRFKLTPRQLLWMLLLL